MLKRFIFSLISFILIYLIVNFSRQTWKLWQTGRLVEEKQRQLDMVEEKNSQLQSELEKVQSSEYIEAEAREKLGMGKAGEKVIIMPGISPDQGKINKRTLNEQSLILHDKFTQAGNWQKWWNLFIY